MVERHDSGMTLARRDANPLVIDAADVVHDVAVVLLVDDHVSVLEVLSLDRVGESGALCVRHASILPCPAASSQGHLAIDND